MLDNLRRFINELTVGNGHGHRAFGDDDYRLVSRTLARAALLEVADERP